MGANKGTTKKTLPQYGMLKAKNQIQNGAVAQLGERFTCTEEVAGSIPVSSTIMENK